MSAYEETLKFIIDTDAAQNAATYHLCVFDMLEETGLMKMIDGVANGDMISSFVSLGTDYLLKDQGRYISMATTVAMPVLYHLNQQVISI